MKKSILLFSILSLIGLFAKAAAPAVDPDKQFGPRPLDGVYVEALQNYSNPRVNHFAFNFGIWPIQPYYNGFSLDVGYSHYFNKDEGWEVGNLAYLYTVDTGLTNELADRYSVDPRKIERVNFILSSNYLRTLAYGKFIFFGKNIRYFRSNLIVGPALISTNSKPYIGACAGWGFETFVNDQTSWQISLRDYYAMGSDHPHNLAFTVGTSYGF